MSSIHPATGASFGLQAPSGQPIPEHISRQAVDWLILLQSGTPTASERHAWMQWRAVHADHERAWRHIEYMQGQMGSIDSTVAHGTLANKAIASRSRRKVMACMAMACTGGGAWWLYQAVPGKVLLADYRTSTGQIQTVMLEDGTRLVLNTGTAVNVTFDAGQRLVTLLAGEILIDTAQDVLTAGRTVARPFLVKTAQGRLRALGTRFSVRQYDAYSQLHVFEGAVEIRPTGAYATPVVIAAGGQTSFTNDAVAALEASHAGGATWVQGMLVAHDMPLQDFLTELSRYRTGWLQCEDRIAGLRVSGIYPVKDTELVLDMLQRTLPIELDRITRYWITVREKH